VLECSDEPRAYLRPTTAPMVVLDIDAALLSLRRSQLQRMAFTSITLPAPLARVVWNAPATVTDPHVGDPQAIDSRRRAPAPAALCVPPPEAGTVHGQALAGHTHPCGLHRIELRCAPDLKERKESNFFDGDGFRRASITGTRRLNPSLRCATARLRCLSV
jgi:hypothetical protein